MSAPDPTDEIEQDRTRPMNEAMHEGQTLGLPLAAVTQQVLVKDDGEGGTGDCMRAAGEPTQLEVVRRRAMQSGSSIATTAKFHRASQSGRSEEASDGR